MTQIVPTNIPFTSNILESCIHRLANKYPNLAVTTIGHSRKGRPIHAISIGSGPASYMYNAAHHANEWITAVILARFAEEMAQEQNAIWHSRATLHMIPMVNPDGVDMVISGNAPPTWKANAIGVDLNSNYPAGWELARKHKYARGYTAPGPRDYVGPAPLCEPESMAMHAFTKLIAPALTLSLHTQGEEIYWRYGHYMPPGAAKMANLLANASGYQLVDVPSESSHAGYRDWFIQEFNSPGYTIECGLGVSPLPISDFGDIYAKVRPLMVSALEYDTFI